VQLAKLLWSSVGKKLLTGVTGLGLAGFVAAHLAGNLLLLTDNPDPFNEYAHFLHTVGHGKVLYLMELGLIAFFLTHIVTGVSIALNKLRSRPISYQKEGNAGGNSQKTLSSLSMAFTGLLLLVFVVLHVKHFKYGPGMEDGYQTVLHGETVRDLYKFVVEEFGKFHMVALYTLTMLMLGLHLRHGFWSAFQSLGIRFPKFEIAIHQAGLLFSLLMSFGFIAVPLIVFAKSLK